MEDKEYVEKLEELLCKSCQILPLVEDDAHFKRQNGFSAAELYIEIKETVGS